MIHNEGWGKPWVRICWTKKRKQPLNMSMGNNEFWPTLLLLSHDIFLLNDRFRSRSHEIQTHHTCSPQISSENLIGKLRITSLTILKNAGSKQKRPANAPISQIFITRLSQGTQNLCIIIHDSISNPKIEDLLTMFLSARKLRYFSTGVFCDNFIRARVDQLPILGINSSHL